MFLLGLKIRSKNFWACEISRKFPNARFKMLDVHPFRDGARGIVDISGKIEIDTLKRFLKRSMSIKKFHILFSDTSKTILSLHFKYGPLSKIITRTDIHVKPPMTLESGYMLVNVVGEKNDLSTLLKELRKKRSLDVSIQRRAEMSHYNVPKLTEKQLRIMKAAIENGYYNVPRKITIAKLAKKLGISQSNLAEHLQKAERRIILETMSD
ncbi:MAG: helix-turn-helix domain-containing protein [Candidatus Aenigmatarchaeota archaeon]